MNARVLAVIPAYDRPELLRGALRSLEGQAGLAGAVVINNSGSPLIDAATAGLTLPVRLVHTPVNLGTAGGIALGMRVATTDPSVSHLWVLDDDAEATPGTSAVLLSAMEKEQADAAVPLLVDRDGFVRWLPGPLPRRLRVASRRSLSPTDFGRQCGPMLPRWNWALWASLLLTRRVVERVGAPRLDLWSQGSDLEYTLRVTAVARGICVPQAFCRHLPTEQPGAAFDAKLASAMQNAAYLTSRFPHGRRFARHLPGLFYRYVRHYRGHPASLWHGFAAYWRGGVQGRSAGRDFFGDAVDAAERALADSAG